MFNINTPGQYDYAFINFLQEGDDFLSPVGSNWAASGTCFWNTAGLDSNGWPNQACANGLTFGGGIRYPSSAQFSGQYTVDGSGLGVFNVGVGTFFVLSSGVQCGGVPSGTAPNTTGAGWGYSSAVNANITTNDTAGTGFCIPFTISGLAAPELTSVNYSNTCSTTSGACVGAFIKNVRLYQQRDYARLNAGNIYRSEYLQNVANLDPSYVRFMDWGPGDGYSTQIRYENRPHLTTSGIITGSYWLASPPYTVSTGTNLLSVASASGMPVSMVHGEVATFKFGNRMNPGATFFGPNTVTAVSQTSPGQVTVANLAVATAAVSAGGTGFGNTLTGNIVWTGSGCSFPPVLNVTTNAAGAVVTINSIVSRGVCTTLPPVATTWTAPNGQGLSNGTGASFTLTSENMYSTGDVVIHSLASGNMPKLNLYPVCITVVDSLHYTMQVFTVATNTCTATPVDTTMFGAFSASGSNLVTEYTSLNVGARGNFPISDADGQTPITTYFIAGAGSYAANMVFDKNSCAITDGSGNLICGSWLVNHGQGLSQGAGGQGAGQPPSVLEAEVKYINEVNALLTGGQHPVGLWINIPHMGLLPTDPDYTDASGYARNMARTIISGTYPLCAGCPVIFENSNEWWNLTVYPTASYYSRQNFFRYGVTGSQDFGTLRTIQMFEDIHNNSGVYNPSVMHFAAMGATTGFGGDPNFPGSNNTLIFGDATVLSDSRWPNAAAKPYQYFDFGGYAPYTSAPVVFYTANFTTLSANWCTAQSTACALTPPFAPNCVGAIDTTYCLPFVNGIFGPASADLSTITDLRTADLQYQKALYSVGKSYVRYEGGASWSTCSISDCSDNGTPLGAVPQQIQTAAQRNYMIALYQSQSWAAAWSAYCQGMMSDTSSGGCGNLSIQQNPAVDFRFSYASPDLFGSTTTEGNGLIPLWTSQSTINAGQP
jgi:hypothetical protein